ncbi:MAG: hypothetical protein WAX12_17215, partial [Candidatus Microthrix subdominans]
MTSAGPAAEDRPTPAWRLLLGRIARRMPAEQQVAAIVRVAGLAYVLLAAINVARATTYLPAGRLPYFSDSLVFLRTGASAPWSLDLWAGTYPFG